MKLITDSNIKSKLISLLDKNFVNSKVFVFTGDIISSSIAQELLSFRNNVYFNKAKDDKGFIEYLNSEISDKDIVIGVGGGFVVDFAKEISFVSKTQLILVPTVLTNDGLASGLVVLGSVNSGKSIYRKKADYIFVDFSVINNSPEEFYLSAVGELFSKFSSYNDWLISDNKNNNVEKHILLGLEVFESRKYLNNKNILHALISLGKAINNQGESSPASGSEHLLFHALNNLGFLKNVRHGVAVASISAYTLFLQNKLEPKHLQILKELKIENNFLNLGVISETDLSYIFDYAKSYKTNRVTILNSFSTEELIERYKNFKLKLL